jgi:hypothetical protein
MVRCLQSCMTKVGNPGILTVETSPAPCEVMLWFETFILACDTGYPRPGTIIRLKIGIQIDDVWRQPLTGGSSAG